MSLQLRLFGGGQSSASKLSASNDGSHAIDKSSELNSIKESLELLLNQSSNDSGSLAVVNLSTRQREQAYRNAKAEYEYLMPFIKEEEEGG